MDSCLDRMDLSLHTQADSDRRVWHFNVAFIGSCRVGKTKLLQRFVDSQFSDIYSQTAETSFVSKSVSIGRHHVVFQCWDTPGSSRASSCIDSRLAQLHAVFIVFDASRDTVADLEHWHHLAMTSADGGGGVRQPLLVLVANKTDLGSHEGSMTRARDLCRARGGLIFALSVLTDEENLEVDAMMLEVGKALTERHSREAAASAVAAVAAAEAADAAAAAAAADSAAAAAAAAPHVAGDRLEQPSPAPVSQPPTVVRSPEAPDAPDGQQAEGDQLPAAAAAKAEDSEGGGAERSWWARAICCCTCW